MLQDITPAKTRFLLKALPDVPFDDWTEELVARTARALRLGDSAVRVAFPGGARDLAIYFSLWATDETLKKLKKKKLGEMRVRDRIALGVRTRLEILTPHKEAVRSALTLMARPPLTFAAPRLVWHTADRLWWAAGDTATDYNHYTKRGLLSGVITATTFFWLNDTSDDHTETWEFLDRRIDDVLKVGRKISELKKKRA